MSRPRLRGPGAAAVAVAAALLLAAVAGVLLPRTDARVAGSSSAAVPTGSSAGPTAAASTGPAGAAAIVPPGLDDAARTNAGVQSLLDRRAAQIASGDGDALLADVSTRDLGFLDQQRVLAANIAVIPFGRWSYQVRGLLDDRDRDAAALRRRLGDDVVVASVVVGYRLKGYDVQDVRSLHRMAFVPSSGGYRVVSDTDTAPFREVWDVAPVQVVTRPRAIVLSASDAVPATELARQADAAVASVDQVWGKDWSQRLVLVVPHDQRQLGQLLRRDSRVYDNLAAVTTAEAAGTTFDGPANRVWFNPGALPKVSALGRAIVLRHETTHVATGAAVPGAFPLWLEEGLADYVGYRGTGLRVGVAAGALMADVRAGRVPARLPSDADFRPQSARLDQAYQGSRLAARMIADRYGERALVRVYRAALAAPDQATAADTGIRQVLGLTPPEFVAQWRDYLRQQATS